MLVTSSEKLIYELGERQNTSVALGFFDGVHLAHQAIVRSALSVGGLVPCVYTFSNPPRALTGAEPVTLLTPPAVKRAIFETLGVEAVIEDDFSPEMMRLSPEDFFREILVQRLRARAVSAGFHYRFGRGRAGDAHTLRHLGEKYGIAVSIVPRVEEAGRLVSSSRIRSLLAEGKIEAANALLGYNFFLRGPVRAGRKIGRTIGLPTANLEVADCQMLPRAGVYATVCHADGRWFRSITNVGDNPTVGGKSITVETHLLDFNGDLYGKEVDVRFCSCIRGEIHFPDVAALRAQVEQDMTIAAQSPLPE